MSRERHVNKSRENKHLCCILKVNKDLQVQNALMILLVNSMKHRRKKRTLLNSNYLSE